MIGNFDSFYYLYYYNCGLSEYKFFHSLKEANDFIKSNKDISIVFFNYISLVSFDVKSLRERISNEE